MPKAVDVPNELRAFNKLFEHFTYRHDHSRVFTDLLHWTALSFAFPHPDPDVKGALDEKFRACLQPYQEDERKLLPQLLHEAAKVTQAGIEAKGWYDVWGDFYQILSSQSKSQALGQFFTPDEVCDMTSMIVMGQQEPYRLVNDCAAGSGRFLLSHHSRNPGARNYYCAGDVDFICVLMCAVNMLWHGMEGEVIWMDTLRMQWKGGWRVNPWLHTLGFPCLVQMLGPRDSYTFGGRPLMFTPWENAHPGMYDRPEPEPVPEKKAVMLDPPGTPKPVFKQQLSLFDIDYGKNQKFAQGQPSRREVGQEEE